MSSNDPKSKQHLPEAHSGRYCFTGIPRFRALIDWVPHGEGGRKMPPRLDAGERYTAPASVGSWSGVNYATASWSLIVNEVHWMNEFQCAATVQYLVDEAPHERLVPGAQFELYEGKRCVARGRIEESIANHATTRLGQFLPMLSIALRDVPETKRLAARVIACEMAISSAGVEDEAIERLLMRLRQGAQFTAAERAEIGEIAFRVDEEYLRLHEASDFDHVRVGEAMRAFAKASAIAAVAFAGIGTIESDEDAIYEATHAIERNGSEMIEKIRETLKSGE